MGIGHFILKNGVPVQLPDGEEGLFEWGRWMQDCGSERIIERTQLSPTIRVSTVFLGIDHSFSDDGPPILYETMVFGGEIDGYQRRYATLGEAKFGHFAVLRAVDVAERGKHAGQSEGAPAPQGDPEAERQDQNRGVPDGAREEAPETEYPSSTGDVPGG